MPRSFPCRTGFFPIDLSDRGFPRTSSWRVGSRFGGRGEGSEERAIVCPSPIGKSNAARPRGYSGGCEGPGPRWRLEQRQRRPPPVATHASFKSPTRMPANITTHGEQRLCGRSHGIDPNRNASGKSTTPRALRPSRGRWSPYRQSVPPPRAPPQNPERDAVSPRGEGPLEHSSIRVFAYPMTRVSAVP